MEWLNTLVRSEILALKPYSSARNECQGDAQVKLDANESPQLPFGQGSILSPLNRYPEPQPQQLKARLASLYRTDPSHLLLTRGIDEGIDLLIKTFCIPYQDKIVITPPTFGYYEVAARIQGAKIIKIPLLEEDGFQQNWESLSQLCGVKVIFLCTPNNPTGDSIPLSLIKELCQAQLGQAVIVVDEAYVEFSDQDSAVCLLAECENLVILRTLSKAYGLAGARIGGLIARQDMIAILKKVISPYPIPAPSVEVALKSLSALGIAYTQQLIAVIKEQRELVYQMLKQLPECEKIYPSQANFILIKINQAAELYQRLKAAGIIIRSREQDIPNTLRISIGTAEENQLLLTALGLVKGPLKLIRQAVNIRKTNETEVYVQVVLDDKNQVVINTGIRFFDHMLEQLARHSGMSLQVRAIGDIDVDVHHTIEDVAIVLGQTLKVALGNKRGINRYGFVLPMDDANVQVSLDLSGRGYCEFNAIFPSPMVSDFPVEMVKHFFTTLSQNLEAAIHLEVKGENTHHMIEACFKGFAKVLKQAMMENGDQIPSTKGVI